MKIAYCINATYNSAGMERVLMLKANYLADILKHEVHIIRTQQQKKENFFNFSSAIHFHDLDINYCLYDKYNIFIRTILKYHKKKLHKAKLEKLLKEIKVDICISMFDYEFNILPKINDNSIKVLESHFCKYQKTIEAQSILLRIIQNIRINSWKNIIKKYKKFVVLTKEDKDYWGNLSNIEVISNPINKFPEKYSSLKSKNIISIGRITYQKNFESLIDAWALIASQYPDWNLTIYGGGDPTELEKRIMKLNISKNTFICPPTSNIENVYLNASILAMTSRYEGLPMVLLESLSYGVPVVAFNFPCGPKDFLNPQFSSIVKMNDLNGLSIELSKWIDNYENRKEAGFSAREFIKDYTIENIMNKWVSLFNNILNK
ncbi:MAG: glycosyltransferase [Phocaeicola sp.]|nr:glycosyltransferase [Phocaeicola sp.]